MRAQTLPQIKALSTEINKSQSLAKEMANAQNQYNKELAKDITQKTARYKETLKLSEANKKAKRDLLDEIKFNKAAVGSLAQKEIKLKKLRAEYRAGNAQMRAQTLPQIKALSTEVNKLNSNIGLNQGKVGGYFKTFTQGMKSMIGMYVGIQGLRMLFTNITGTLIGFEKEMSGVKAITGATDAEFAQLQANAKLLGSETSKTAVEIAGLQKAYGLLGFSTQEILNATEATILLSQATGEDLAKSSEIAGATIRGFGLGANETGRIVDIMAASFTSSALNLERFGEAMKFIAPIAKATGFSVEEVTANMSKLADAGIHGSMAGTSLRRVMLEMGKAGLKGSEGLDEMAKKGITVADANDEVGARAATALLILSEQKDGINELTDAYSNASGAAKEMADIQMDNLAGSITLLSSAWDGWILQMSDSNGAVRGLVDSITDLIHWLTRNSKVVGIVLKVMLRLSFAWAAYNVALRLSKTLIGGYIGNLLKSIVATKAQKIATTQATVAQKGLNTAMKLNPFGIAITAIMALLPLLDSFTEKTDEAGYSLERIQDGIDALAVESQKNINKSVSGGLTEIEAIGVEMKRQEEQLKVLNAASRKINTYTDEEFEANTAYINSIQDGLTATYKTFFNLKKRQNDLIKSDKDNKNKLSAENKKANEELLKQNQKAHIKQLEQDKALWISRLELTNASQRALLYTNNQWDTKILDAKLKYHKINEDQYETSINKIQKKLHDFNEKNKRSPFVIGEEDEFNTLNSAPKSIEKTGVSKADIDLATRLKVQGLQGFTDEENAQMLSAYQELASGLDQIFQVTQNKWQALIQEFNQNISEQNGIVSRELAAQSAGLANTYDQEKLRLEQLQQSRDVALEKQKKNQIVSLRLKQAEQATNIALAISELYASEAKLGAVGVAAAVISTGVMLGSIAATESQIQSLKKYKDGGELNGASHDNGGIKLVNKQGMAFAEAEGNEFIVNKKAYSESRVITNMINDRKLTDKEFFGSQRMAREIKLSGLDSSVSATRDLTRALLKSSPIDAGDYTITRNGNNLTRRRK